MKISTLLVALALVAGACAPAAAGGQASGSGPSYGAPAASQPTAASAAGQASGSSPDYSKTSPSAAPTAAAASSGGYGAQAYGSSGSAAAAGGAQVALGKNDQYGSFLADSKGMSLYLFMKDTPGTSNCYGKCATAWPPLLTSGAPVAGTGLDASKLGTTTRTDGTTQVTYNGWPLYYYVKDSQPGDTAGQNVGSVWFLVAPSGEAVQ